MNDVWRELLYPLGFLSAIAFTSRALLQWLNSEAKGKSVVTPTFWKISLCGNLLLAVHSLIQVQFHVCAIQTCNAIISWRNINLMGAEKRRASTKRTLAYMGIALSFMLGTFFLQSYLSSNAHDWFRVPTAPWQNHAIQAVGMGWHIVGFIGMAFFSSRFWLQWWSAEKSQQSHLGATFWWASLLGEFICLIYFLHIQDAVNFIGPLFAMIPYVRNLMLINKTKKLSKQKT